MRTISDEELLKTCSLEECKQAATFGALSRNTIAWLLREGRILALDDGDVLFEPGSRGDSFFIILDGAIAY